MPLPTVSGCRHQSCSTATGRQHSTTASRGELCTGAVHAAGKFGHLESEEMVWESSFGNDFCRKPFLIDVNGPPINTLTFHGFLNFCPQLGKDVPGNLKGGGICWD